MMTGYGVEIADDAVDSNLYRIGNQIFKLLPMREEEKDWLKPLQTLFLELLGMACIFPDQKDLLQVCAKMRGLEEEGETIDFWMFRRTIFECCGIVSRMREQCQ